MGAGVGAGVRSAWMEIRGIGVGGKIKHGEKVGVLAFTPQVE